MANILLPLRSPGSVSGSSVCSQMSEASDEYDFILEQHVKLDVLQRKLREANALLADKEAECDTLTEKLDEKNKECDELIEECADWRTELSEKEGEYDELKEKLDEKEEENDQLRVDLSAIWEDEQQDGDREAAHLMEVEGLNKLVQGAQDELARVAEAMATERRRRKKVERKVKQCEAELEAAKREAETQREELERAKREVEQANKKKHEKENLLKLFAKKAKGRYSEMETKISELETSVNNLTKSEKDLKHELSASAMEKNTAWEQLDESRDEVASLKGEAERWKQERECLTQKVKRSVDVVADEMNNLKDCVSPENGQNGEVAATVPPLQFQMRAGAAGAERQGEEGHQNEHDFPSNQLCPLLDAAQNIKLTQQIDQMVGIMKEKDKTINYGRKRNIRLQKTVSDLEGQLKQFQGQGQIAARASGSKRPADGQGQVRVQGPNESEGVARRFEPARKKQRVGGQGHGARFS